MCVCILYAYVRLLVCGLYFVAVYYNVIVLIVNERNRLCVPTSVFSMLIYCYMMALREIKINLHTQLSCVCVCVCVLCGVRVVVATALTPVPYYCLLCMSSVYSAYIQILCV